MWWSELQIGRSLSPTRKSSLWASFAGPPRLRPTKKGPPSCTKKLNLMNGFLGLGRDEGGVVGALANGLRGNAGQSGEYQVR